MSVKSWIVALFFPLVILSGSSRAEDLRSAMEAANQQWLAAFNTPNVAAFSAMYTEDAVLIPSGAPLATGPEAITKFFEAAINRGLRDHTYQIIETRSDGNLAYLLSSWTVKQVKSGDEVITTTGTTLRVLVKQNDGGWKTKVHMFIRQNPPTSGAAKK